jgi:hypothetical protein
MDGSNSKSLTLAESRFALAALERLPADPRAADMLRSMLRVRVRRACRRSADAPKAWSLLLAPQRRWQ